MSCFGRFLHKGSARILSRKYIPLIISILQSALQNMSFRHAKSHLLHYKRPSFTQRKTAYCIHTEIIASFNIKILHLQVALTGTHFIIQPNNILFSTVHRKQSDTPSSRYYFMVWIRSKTHWTALGQTDLSIIFVYPSMFLVHKTIWISIFKARLL